MKAIIIFSGGLDSTVILAHALNEGRYCYAVSFDYGQRHVVELEHAKAIAKHFDVPHRIIKIDQGLFGESTLVNAGDIPKNRTTDKIRSAGIPNTYVPARNTLFLAYAMGQAEVLKADEIYAGPNALDYHAYPDCRPEYYRAIQGLANVATKRAVEGNPPKVITPLIHMDKVEIIFRGMELEAPLHMTHSCYDPTEEGKPCEHCDACLLRKDGFQKAEAMLAEQPDGQRSPSEHESGMRAAAPSQENPR